VKKNDFTVFVTEQEKGEGMPYTIQSALIILSGIISEKTE